MDLALWGLIAQAIPIFAIFLILYLYSICADRRSNDVVLPASGNAPPPSSSSSSASRSNFGPPSSESEENCEIVVYNEGSVEGKSSINEENDCAICLSEFIKGETYIVLPACLHKFHADCVMIWLASNIYKTCPVCRTHVSFIHDS